MPRRSLGEDGDSRSRSLKTMENIIAIYKPSGPTSHDIINELRKITGIRKIGHAGTLDPQAKGVLVVGIGREATKRLSEVVRKEKEYIATIRLGQESTTDDREGEKTKIEVINIPSDKIVNKVITNFKGKITQTPPVYSAIKVKGKRAYKSARQGKEIKLEPRKVLIKKIEILNYRWPELSIRVVTGPGVYIRSLARDIGKDLEVGGYLSDLERVRVGDFIKERSLSLSQFQDSYTIEGDV